jgi:hypothetical protein
MPIDVSGLCGIFLVVAAIILGIQINLLRFHDLPGAELRTFALGQINAMVEVPTCGDRRVGRGVRHHNLLIEW